MYFPRVVEVSVFAGILLPACFAQATTANAAQNDQPPLPRFGIAVNVGTLGAGIEAATAIHRRLNIRGGFSYFSYDLSGTSSDNLGYDAALRLEFADALVDYFPVKWFHLSGGALIYDGFQGKGTISVPGGQSLTLNGVKYYSSAANPVTGTADIVAQKAAGVVLFGFGNMLPRNQHHFSVTSDFGIAFQGSPTTTLNLIGSTCATPTTGCAPISAQPSVQANVIAEQSKINKDIKPYGSYYPILRISFGYKFK